MAFKKFIIIPNTNGISIPLKGMKASANILAQKVQACF